MTREPEPHSSLGDIRPSSPSISDHGEIQPIHAEKAEGVAGTAMIAPGKGGPTPEKALSTHNNVQAGILGTTTSKNAPDATETTANPASRNDFSEEDKEYISGYKLYAALFGIICVFFLVLLDFSITATVSIGSFQNSSLSSGLHRCLGRRI